MVTTKVQQVLDIVKKEGVIRPRDLNAHGIARVYLKRMSDRGLLEHVGRGLYALPDAILTENHTLAEAAKRVPRGVVCLLSALKFHGLTTQLPFEVWFTIEEKARKPRFDRPRMRFVRFSGQSFEAGIEEHKIEGVTVRIYSLAKTVADCFKYRNKIGLDVAIEALRECRRQRKCSNDELWHL
ncbi:MAG: AbiEi antitoxin N-terminal domain-containing protein [Actinomycetota bacterium]|nr:AbiEi antitoxin N-terminal domain-containing protein [Actinomycetota bacterium]